MRFNLNNNIKLLKDKLFSSKRKVNRSVWKRYANWIMPLATALVLIINSAIYVFISNGIKQQVQENSMELVELQAKNIEQTFFGHMYTIGRLFDGFRLSRLDEYMRKADRYAKSHPEKMANYIRITFPDGRSYTSDRGLDTLSFANFTIPRLIFKDKVPYVLNSPYYYYDNVKTGHYAINFPLVVNDTIVAVITSTIRRELIDAHLSQLKLNGIGVPGMINNKEMVVVFRDSDQGEIIRADEFESRGYFGLDKILKYSDQGKLTGKCTKEEYIIERDGEKHDVTVYCSYLKGSDWGVTLSIISSEHNRYVKILMVIMIAISVVTILVLFFGLRYITSRMVLKPVEKVNTFAKEFADGKIYSDQIDSMNNEDEFGQMKLSMADMKGKIVEVVSDIRNHAGSINQVSDTLVNLVRDIDESAQSQAVSTEEISASIENITNSIQHINDNAYEAQNISEELSADISKIASFSRTTLATIENVLSKITVINDITQRTDMLAINASAEAARAGKYGSGFAQVAGEIRKLAVLCQTASQEINASSAQSLKITEFAVNLVASIEPKVKDNARMVAEISSSCGKQISHANSMASHIQQLVEVTSNNTANADELSHYVDSLNNSCQKLVDSVEFFKLTDNECNREQLLSEIKDCTDEIARLRGMLNKNASSNK